MGIAQQATYKPLNLYIMMDASSSMSGNKWTDASAGLATFLTDPTVTDVDVALSFFPRPADATPACDQNAYKAPIVPFAPIADNAQPIADALAARTPDGFNSPMFPALGGALLEGIDLAQQDSSRVSAVLLVTDGKPEGPGASCAGVDPSDPAEVAALAASGANFDPPVKTLVIGLPGVDATIANQIAAAGGTDSAVVVGTTNTAQKFADAIFAARGSLLACEFEIPEEVAAGQVGVGYVNVTLTPGGQGPQILHQNQGCAGGDGWQFDDPAAPKAILLCDGTCAGVKDDKMAAIEIVLGCPTVQ